MNDYNDPDAGERIVVPVTPAKAAWQKPAFKGEPVHRAKFNPAGFNDDSIYGS